MIEKTVLWDHYSATIHLDISEPQPQYGLIQLNAVRDASKELISCDVNKEEFLSAIERICGVTIVRPQPETNNEPITRGEVVAAAEKARDHAIKNMQWNYDSLEMSALQVVSDVLSVFIEELEESLD